MVIVDGSFGGRLVGLFESLGLWLITLVLLFRRWLVHDSVNLAVRLGND
jgi:hypothetical protein